MKHAAIDKSAEMNTLIQLNQDVVYLMGLSFVLGSLFTIFVLIVLDFMRRDKTKAE